MGQNVNAAIQAVNLVNQILEDEEADQHELEMAAARIAVEDMMELEEGVGFHGGAAWIYITVDINEYHLLGDPCFNLHFRMSRGVFEILVQTVGNFLLTTGRMLRERMPLQDCLLMVVWLLATPDTFRSVSLRFGVAPSSLYYSYTKIIEALRAMAPMYIKWPDAAERAVVKDTFRRVTGFPGVVGCIDGTHVYISAPLEDAAQYRNRHDGYSINVQATVDCNLVVRDIHVGEVGSMNDRRVFRRSPLFHDLVTGQGERLLPDEHILGDGAYGVTDYMLTPFRNNGHLNDAQLNFNRRLSQCRVRVENSFARAKGKWRRLKYLHVRNAVSRVDHITASFVLHNFTLLHGEPMLPEHELGRPIQDDEVLGIRDFEDNDDDDERDIDELLRAAEARGEEKRIFIMDNLDAFH